MSSRLSASPAAATSAHNSDPAAHLNIVRSTLAANLALMATDAVRQHITPDADRSVTLPAEVAGTPWQFLLSHVGSAYTLTVKRASGTNLGVIIPDGGLSVVWDGTGIVIS